MTLSRKKVNAQIFLYLHNQKELSGCSFLQKGEQKQKGYQK